jgi:hypothetical protein
MKKSVFIWLIGTFALLQLQAHVGLTNPEGGESYKPGDIVDVTWVVLQAHNTLNWDLLFSEDGGSSWDTIKIDISVETTSYQWIVPETMTMKGKIRIVQDNENQDYEGTSNNFTISSTIGITDLFSPIPLHIYPNPLTHYTSIEFENPMHKNHTLSLYDTQGRMVISIPNITSGKVQVEREDITAGLYFIRLRDENEIRALGKLVVK